MIMVLPSVQVILYYPLLLYKDSTPSGGSVSDTFNFGGLHFSEMFRSYDDTFIKSVFLGI